ncbi:hypothetical protein G6F24_015482 [Rhizopus arrhizus]|nr:hypothetical protein G6F24_015482 [Rhizopus arrhizus]
MVALRELVQNAHDSIIRRRIEQPGVDVPSRIAVQVDAGAGVLRITDTGAGLTRQEIHDYLAPVGVGCPRGLRQGGEDDDGLIGMFGLGFLSAFVLARRQRRAVHGQRSAGTCGRHRGGAGAASGFPAAGQRGAPARGAGPLLRAAVRADLHRRRSRGAQP